VPADEAGHRGALILRIGCPVREFRTHCFSFGIRQPRTASIQYTAGRSGHVTITIIGRSGVDVRSSGINTPVFSKVHPRLLQSTACIPSSPHSPGARGHTWRRLPPCMQIWARGGYALKALTPLCLPEHYGCVMNSDDNRCSITKSL